MGVSCLRNICTPQPGAHAKELSQWLDHYHDHPAASRISWLAKNANACVKSQNPRKRVFERHCSNLHDYRARIPAQTAGRNWRQTRAIASKVRQFVGVVRQPAIPISLMNKLLNISPKKKSQLRGEIAHAYFIFGFDQKAIRAARQTAAGQDVTKRGWVCGQAAWQPGGQVSMIYRKAS